MLIGNAVHNLDAKGRIVIPAKYREDFGASVYALKGVGGCIRLYPYEQFMKLSEKVREGDVTQIALRRKVFGSVEHISLDAQGRILLSDDLKKSAGITDKVRMVGMFEWLELWNEESFEQADQELTDEEEIKLMAQLGLA